MTATSAARTSEEFAHRFAQELALTMHTGHGEVATVALEVTVAQALALVAHIDLALRHPENTGPAAETARTLGRTICGALAPTPALQAMLREVWGPTLRL